MQLSEFIAKVKDAPESIEFADTMQVIAKHYHYQPTAFTNAQVSNPAGRNEGSCKIFAFGQLNHLTEDETLACFGHYYRDHVLNHPDKDDHANIRQFMETGWQGITFEKSPLVAK